MTQTNSRILYGLVNYALLAAGLANLGVGTWAALHNGVAIAATSLTAGLVLLFAATIDRFESLKGLGIEAKTRQLDQKIVEADTALRRLREMTELTGGALIELQSKVGRMDAAPLPRESIAFATRIREIMKSQGSDESVIANVLRPWARVLCFDMALAMTRNLRDLLHDRLRVLESERQKINQPIRVDDPIYADLSNRIRLIRDFIKSRLDGFHRLQLDEYPDRFMEVFDTVPGLEAQQLETLRRSAARFVPGMTLLRQSQTLVDSELWIEELNRSRDG